MTNILPAATLIGEHHLRSLNVNTCSFFVPNDDLAPLIVRAEVGIPCRGPLLVAAVPRAEEIPDVVIAMALSLGILGLYREV